MLDHSLTTFNVWILFLVELSESLLPYNTFMSSVLTFTHVGSRICQQLPNVITLELNLVISLKNVNI